VLVRRRERAHQLRPLQYDHRVGAVLGERQRLVDQLLVVQNARRLDSARRGHQDGGCGVLDPRRQLARREAAEHHRVHGTESSAGQHGDDGLWHHGQVKHNAVALVDA
jgi:hypothetical protein